MKDLRAVEPLIASLGDSDEYVRRNAAEALGELKDLRAVEPLIKALGDSNWEVCYKAVLALGELKDTRSIEPLVKTHTYVGGVREASFRGSKRICSQGYH